MIIKTHFSEYTNGKHRDQRAEKSDFTCLNEREGQANTYRVPLPKLLDRGDNHSEVIRDE